MCKPYDFPEWIAHFCILMHIFIYIIIIIVIIITIIIIYKNINILYVHIYINTYIYMYITHYYGIAWSDHGTIGSIINPSGFAKKKARVK
jgi:hypothetical protein